jgi:hypothetical protein
MRPACTGVRVASWLLLAVTACGPSISHDGDDDQGGGACQPGERRCRGLTLETCTGGTFATTAVCPTACDASLGCTSCQPDTGTCDGATSHACRSDGTGYEDVFCDPVQGMTCGERGVCEGACSPIALGETYVGCDYWPTVTGNMVSSYYDFAVAVSNTTGAAAMVTIDGGALGAPLVFPVAPESTVVQRLPWVAALKLCNQLDASLCRAPALGALAAGGAYHLRASAPVTVYQFNPLDFYKPGAPTNSYSNDASLLFPTNAWRGNYLVAAWPVLTDGVVAWPSELVVTAHQAGTQVTITTRAGTSAAGGAPAFIAGVPQTVTLGAGDALEITSITGDLTGSTVTSTRPVEVFGAHYCAYAPNIPSIEYGYCDHLEESMFPIDALGDAYVVVAPAVTTIPQGKEEMVRIIATEPGTTLSYDPPVPGAATTIAAPGDFVEIGRNAASFVVTANHKVLVSQYMEGSQVAGNTGDPSMALAVPVDQYRSSYLFHAPTNYTTNYVDVIAPTGTSVILDGTVLGGFTPIGGSGYAVARVTPLGAGPRGDGNHAISSSSPFGISVYGYGQDTSYWYPGGLDLELVPVGRLHERRPSDTMAR